MHQLVTMVRENVNESAEEIRKAYVADSLYYVLYYKIKYFASSIHLCQTNEFTFVRMFSFGYSIIIRYNVGFKI